MYIFRVPGSALLAWWASCQGDRLAPHKNSLAPGKQTGVLSHPELWLGFEFKNPALLRSWREISAQPDRQPKPRQQLLLCYKITVDGEFLWLSALGENLGCRWSRIRGDKSGRQIINNFALMQIITVWKYCTYRDSRLETFKSCALTLETLVDHIWSLSDCQVTFEVPSVWNTVQGLRKFAP